MEKMILRISVVLPLSLPIKRTTVGDTIVIDVDDSQLDCALKCLECLHGTRKCE